MAFTNNVMIVRHKLLATLVKLWKEDSLVDSIDRLPIELSPKKSRVMGRCCIHKERAVWKYKSFPLLGFDMTDEKDELTPLSYYAQQATTRTKNLKENIRNARGILKSSSIVKHMKSKKIYWKLS